MLGKQHVSISFASILPFVIPVFFQGDGSFFIYYASLTVAVIVGSLVPDADCGGKPKLYYDFKIVYDIMIPLQKAVIWIFNRSDVKQRLDLEYEVNGRHRGIMHSPIGVLISSILLTLISVFVALVLIRELNIILALVVFAGLLIGQVLHLLEDSCTVSGINWKFPFGTKELKGGIYTYPKEKDKRDIRPMVYEYSLWAITVILIIGYVFELIQLAYAIVYPIIVLCIVAVWAFIIFTSKTKYEFWYQDAKKVQNFRRAMKKIGE